MANFRCRIDGGSLTFLILSVSLVTVGVLQPVTAQEMAKAPDLPSDVVEFISRRTDCIDWMAKSQANPSQAANYAQTMAALRCDDIPSEQVILKNLHQTDTHVIEALDHTYIKVVRRVPVRINPANVEGNSFH